MKETKLPADSTITHTARSRGFQCTIPKKIAENFGGKPVYLNWARVSREFCIQRPLWRQ